ncbi:MAG: 30S ribosomal protein S21, partial [Planctomycetota bacterium]|nr:30S ribosomal protein S21 [Planctomycetota bacterium]
RARVQILEVRNMSGIKIRVEGSIDRALRHFKQKCIDANVFNELKRVAFYEKPSETKRKSDQRKLRTAQKFSKRRFARKPVKSDKSDKSDKPMWKRRNSY